MTDNVYYTRGIRFSDYLWKGLGVLVVGFGMLAAGDALVDFTDMSLTQLTVLFASTGGLVYLGRQLRISNGPEWAVMGLYTWALSALADWVLHIVFLLDIDGVVAPSGLGWLLGPMNYVYFQTEPWWYFVLDTGLIGGIVMAIAAYVMIPSFAPYRFIVWPFIGGVIKSFGYADITRLASELTGGLIAIRGTWSWTSLWTYVYNATLAPTDVPLAYISVTEDWAAVFVLFANLHWAAIWMAAVVAHRAHVGPGNYS